MKLNRNIIFMIILGFVSYFEASAQKSRLYFKLVDEYSNILPNYDSTFLGSYPIIGHLIDSFGVNEIQRPFINLNTRLDRVYLVSFDSTEKASTFKSRLLEIDSIEYVNLPDSVVSNYSFSGESEPLYNQQNYLKQIRADSAWLITQGEGVIVAVIDDGFNIHHPELESNLWINSTELNGTEGVDDDSNGFIDDYYGWNAVAQNSNVVPSYLGQQHGTQVASVIIATKDTSGMIGIAPKAKFIPIKTNDTNSLGHSVQDVYQSLYYAVKSPAHIINMSWGIPQILYTPGLLEDLVNYGVSQDKIMVAACGNENSKSNVNYPAAIPEVISVSAVDSNWEKAPFANYGWVPM